ncbi:hypothetical protein H1D32_07785 [Anaerobacillus sp. CMMVII]|uniref:hypothetical protein n=1 Tax=Anaerobacillus sp. CMMVII TaxID=2755588 RepID=UPI0021B828FB|nr:hypothetical protein [Anaerobacillus sp. CMMVII]MCT8137663.1 hypothetical protein [Anaerobacillus sp. CMMVII]
MMKIKELLNGITGELTSFINERTITVRITSQKLLKILEKQHLPEVTNLDVKIINERIIISGMQKRLLLNINFRIELIPVQSVKRIIYFDILNMKPINQEWMKRRLFNKPNLLSYENKKVALNLNEIDQIKSMPIGNIKKIKVKEDKLLVSLGI